MNKQKTLTPYEKTIRKLSDRIVEAQKPIRILNSLKWGNEVKEFFFKNKFKKLPLIDAKYYLRNNLNFDPQKKTEEFYSIERDIRRQLGQFSSIGSVMQRMCREYREVIRMLLARGTSEFTKISQDLYGSSEDAFYAGAPTLQDLAALVSETLVRLKRSEIDENEVKRYSSEEAVAILSKRLNNYFVDPDSKKKVVKVILSDDIIADAAAGADTVRIRKGIHFSERDIESF